MATALIDGLRQFIRRQRLLSRGLAVALAVVGLLSLVSEASADDLLLVPLTKLRVKAYQLNPTRGEYVLWDTISGEFTIAQDGSISIPLVGTINTANIDVKALPTVLSAALQKKLSLVSPPDISVEVVEYPPIYVSGQVTAPGEYRYRPGITVLRALTLSGGRYRAVATAGALDEFSLVADLKNVKVSIIRAKARIARLQAEIAGAHEIDFPDEIKKLLSNPLVAGIVEQENLLFTTSKSALERQLKTLNELHTLYGAEIANLQEKGKSLDASILDAEDELGRIDQLVRKGIVTTPRKVAQQRDLAGMRSNRLDLGTALMRAQQNAAETTRNSETLHDQEATRAATGLQDTQTNLDQLKIKQSVSENLLGGGVTDQADVDHGSMSYVIVRESAGKTEEITADENTPLRPGDVLKVAVIPAK